MRWCHIFILFILISILALLLAACSEDMGETPVAEKSAIEEVVLPEFFVDASTQYGFTPDELVVRNGALLTFRAYGAAMRITSPELGVDATVLADGQQVVEVRSAPGTYELACDQCLAERNTLTFTVR